MTTTQKKTFQDCDERPPIDYRYSAGKNGECTTHTNPGGADITSSLGMKTTTELCHQKCRRIQACSHHRAGIYNIHHGIGGGATKITEYQYAYGKMVILSSASAVSFSVAVIVIHEKNAG